MENTTEITDIPKGMKKCKVCGAIIAKNAKQCPKCGAKNKKPLYLRGWFIVLVVVVLLIAGIRIQYELNPPMTYKEMMEEVTVVDLKDFAMEHAENNGAFKDKYKDKCIQFTGIVDELNSSGSPNFCAMVWTQKDTNMFPAGWGNKDEMDDATRYRVSVVFADNDEYKKISRGDILTVVGVFNGSNALENVYIVP